MKNSEQKREKIFMSDVSITKPKRIKVNKKSIGWAKKGKDSTCK